MTFGQFLELARKQGVKDEDEIWFFDFHGIDEVEFKYDEEMGWTAS